MLFNSTQFLLFFALFLPTFWLLNRHLRSRNLLLLAASYFFYGSWDWRFLSLIIISTVVDYFCGLAIHAATDPRRRKLWLLCSILVNIGILATFKYFGFFVNSFIDLLNAFGLQPGYFSTSIVLPVGISFYTFQTLTYSIDIYRRELKPTHNFIDFAAFVAFFPQLVAGPIERASRLLPQIAMPAQFSLDRLRDGALLVMWGLFKKVLIADRLAIYVDAVYADPALYGGVQCALATLFFAIQIYCDFSGYSDTARGLARMLGIELMLNFDTPYFASSLKNFWARWHISLSTWFRDYVYIPLGGSRNGPWRTKRNLFLTFLVSGLWHGANYTFVVWGALHGLANIVDPFSRWQPQRAVLRRAFFLAGVVTTFLFVNLTWVFFRADNISDALLILGKILDPAAWQLSGKTLLDFTVAMSTSEFMLALYFIAVLIATDLVLQGRSLEYRSATAAFPLRWAFSWFLLANLLLLAPSDTGSFIYFQF